MENKKLTIQDVLSTIKEKRYQLDFTVDIPDEMKSNPEVIFCILEGEHPDVATSYFNIGQVWNKKGEYDKALEYHVLSSQIRFKKLGASHNLTNKSIENAKRVAKELGKENELPDWMKNN